MPMSFFQSRYLLLRYREAQEIKAQIAYFLLIETATSYAVKL